MSDYYGAIGALLSMGVPHADVENAAELLAGLPDPESANQALRNIQAVVEGLERDNG